VCRRLLPFEAGLNLAQTALVLDRSRRTTCALRTNFCARASGLRPARRNKAELRNRAKSTLQAEAAALDAALAGAAEGAVLVIPGLKDKIEAQLGHSVCLSGVYRMLARHGWRCGDARHGAPARQRADARRLEKKLFADLAQVRARFPAQRPIRVMFQDEARFGRTYPP
jgi:hypothetical protein